VSGTGAGQSPTPAPSVSAASTDAVPSPSVASFAFPSRTAQLAMSEPVRFQTGSAVLAGRLFGHGRTGIVLSHMGPQGNDQTAWWPMAALLARHGYVVLTYDYPGICPGGVAGCSSGRLNSDVTPDVDSALEFLRSQGAEQVVLGGASIGAMGSIDVASRRSDVAALVSVSGVEFAGPYDLDRGVLRHVTCPKLFVAGTFDREAADSARDWNRWAGPPKEAHILRTGLHGTDMLSASGDDAFVPGALVRLLLSFLRRHLPARPS